MSQMNLPLGNEERVLRPRTRREKISIAISLIGFFGAIAALAIYALVGPGSDGEEDTGPNVIFAGGAPASVAAPASGEDTGAAAEEEDPEADTFGEPISETDSADDDGEWGAAAIENSGDSRFEEAGNRRREGRIARGTGGTS